jgi:hypothetical protein
MQNVNDLKIAERTFATSFLSFGVGICLSILVTDTLGKIVSGLVGIALISVVVFGLHKQITAFFYKIGGKVLNNSMAIFMPLIGVIIFAVYPVLLVFITSIGISIEPSITIIAVTSSILALGNLVVLIMNIIALLRRQDDATEEEPVVESQ